MTSSSDAGAIATPPSIRPGRRIAVTGRVSRRHGRYDRARDVPTRVDHLQPGTKVLHVARSAVELIRDLFLASLVTLVFLAPFLVFVAAPFTWRWFASFGVLVVSVTVFGRRRTTPVAMP